MLVLWVPADLRDVVALRRVVHVRQAGVVELQVTAAEVVKPPHLLGVGRGQVGPELAQVRIDRLVNGRAPAPVVHHAQRGDGELGQRGGDGVAQERERRTEDRVIERERGDDVRGRWRPLIALLLVVERHPDRVVLHLADAAELVDEVHVPGLAAQLTVGRRAQPGLLLPADHLADGGVLGLPQLIGAEPACREVLAGPQQFGWAQQAAHMVGPERRPPGRPRRAGGGVLPGALFGHTSVLLASPQIVHNIVNNL